MSCHDGWYSPDQLSLGFPGCRFQFVQFIQRVARRERIDIERVQRIAQRVAVLFFCLRAGGKQR